MRSICTESVNLHGRDVFSGEGIGGIANEQASLTHSPGEGERERERGEKERGKDREKGVKWYTILMNWFKGL